MSTQDSSSGLSIIIPVAGRVKLLEELLKSLEISRSNFTPQNEIIILDNSHTTEEQEVIQKLAANYTAIYQSGSHNLSEKRNQGIQAAQYDIVLFLDSDCIATPNLLRQHYDAYHQGNIAGCLGVIEFTGKDTIIWKAVERTFVPSTFALPKSYETVNWGPTANISFRRKDLLEIDGFDKDFSRPGGEDVDLGFRLRKAGKIISCNPDAIAYHSKDTWNSFRQVYRRFFTYGKGDVLLIKKHPKHTTWDLPTPSHFLIALFLFAGIAFLIIQNKSFLFIPFIWGGLTLLMCPYLTLKYAAKKIEFAELKLEALTMILFTGLDFGRIMNSIFQREWKGLYRRVKFSENQQNEEWPSMSTGTIASIRSLVLTLLIMTLLLTH